MAYRSSSSNTGASKNPATTVPAGIAANDIAILTFNLDQSGSWAVTWPTGFTQLRLDSLAGPDGERMGIAWKRCDGSESGSFTITTSAVSSPQWVCQCALFSGRHTTDPPVAATSATNTSANASPVSITSNSVTAVGGDDLCFVASPDVNATGIANGHTAPSGFTVRQDTENGFADSGLSTQDNVSAGSTSATGTLALTSGGAGWTAYLVRIPSASSPQDTPELYGRPFGDRGADMMQSLLSF